MNAAEVAVRFLLEKEPSTTPLTWPSRLRPGMPADSIKRIQAGVFLDCSKCYERVPLAQLEQFAIERGFPLHALNCALNMYSGNRRILLQGAVSTAVQSTCGLPPGCGLAVDLLHAFLIRSLQSAGRQ
eukprot:5850538-Amphidinium_carterae.1